ncbi:unnamed protein product [Soboliphyme baturini]|uniref:Thioredoxin domain-containing protein 12 n=1 Tax=Soboliphyme baturini TaxID=241478 RepID=A0A183IR49_9BILA|nr:unnamed protein product [Soboliphyme baturini]
MRSLSASNKFYVHNKKSSYHPAMFTDIFRKKPMFLLIHKTWCPACQQLKPKFSKAKKLVEISKHFIMVNTQDDEEPWEEKYKPDGGYIPRILFIGKFLIIIHFKAVKNACKNYDKYLDGNVMDYIKNPTESFEKYSHYYTNPTPIIKSMKEVLLKLKLMDEKQLDQYDDGSKKQETLKTEL